MAIRILSSENVDGALTIGGALTGTTAGFSGSITASGNSNSFGNTSVAALSASTGTFSASITAAGNTNSFGTTTFSGNQVTIDPASGDAILQLQSSTQTLRIDQNSIRTGTSNNLALFTDGNSNQLVLKQSTGNVGIGTSSPDSPLEIEFAEDTGTTKQMLHLDYNPVDNYGSGYLKISAGGSSQALTFIEQVTSGGNGLFGTYIDTNIINKGLSASTHGNINFVTGSSTSASSIVMTIGGGSQKGNVGIGDTSPSTKIDVYQSIVGIGAADFRHVNGNRILINPSYNYYDAYNHIFRGLSGTNTHMTIDLNGSVGIGTTLANGKLHIADTSSSSTTQYFSAASNTATYSYIKHIDNTVNTAKLTLGTVYGYNVPVDAITIFNGNVGIGTASPQNDKLHVETDTSTVYDGNSNQTGGLFVNNIYHEALNTFSQIRLGVSGASGASNVRLVGIEPSQAASDFAIVLRNGSVWGEKLRIKGATGNVGIGTDSPSSRLHVSESKAGNVAISVQNTNASYSSQIRFLDSTGTEKSAVTFVPSDTSLRFFNNGGDRMIITSGGTTEFKRNVDILSDQNTNMFKVRSTSGSFTSSVLLVDCDRTSTNNTYNLANFTNAGTAKCVITDGGDLKNTNNSYGALSDERLKENIIDATPKLDDLMKVKIKTFNLKGDEQKQIGVVAQELEEVFPGMVSSAKTPDSEDETLYKSVKYSVFVPMLIKAIQELKAEIELLKNK